jgi:UDP-N-acetylglucosamine 3-dehydrogenase
MRIGILGAGDMGHTHARVYAGMPDVEIAGIVGRRRERVEQVAGEVNAPALTDPWVILDDDSIEAIDVTYPSALHREWTVAALVRGKHVLCETPMALTVEDADAMIAAAREHDRILMPAQVHRFGVEYAFVHDEVASGTLGRPIAASAATRLSPYGAGTRRPLDLYGGPMLDLMIHPFDTLIWLLGMPTALAGTGRIGPSGTIDHAFVTLDFADACGMVEGSAMMPATFPFTMNLHVLCEGGAIEAWLRLSRDEEFGVVRYPATGEPEVISREGDDPYTSECRYFVRCLRGEADPSTVRPEGERDALRVVLAAQQALQQGERITFLDHGPTEGTDARSG